MTISGVRRWFPVISVSSLLSIIFGLPHLLIPYLLGPLVFYTPFAISGVSALIYDESYIYAPQTNYTLLRWKPAYDTDVFEYRDVPSNMPFLPQFAVAGLAWLTGGLKHAFIVCDFLLPPLAFLLAFLLVRDMTMHVPMAALGAASTILVSFGPRNFFRPLAELAATGWTSALQPIEYSRLLHPQFSFTCFLGALLLLWRTLQGPSMLLAIAAGMSGGILFYVYLYYWPVWLGACALLLLFAWRLHFSAGRSLAVALVLAIASGGYFWVNYLHSRAASNYLWRAARFGVEFGHIPRPAKLQFTAIMLVIFVIFALVFWALVLRHATGQYRLHNRRVLLYQIAVFAAGCAALNMELVTGINVEAMEHYPNRFFQPYLCMAFFILPATAVLGGVSRRHLAWRRACFAMTAALLTVASFRQVAVAINTAPHHAYKEEQRLLYSWLNSRTRMDDVVLCSVSETSYLMPTYTHNRLYIPNGTRTTASNEEILRRFIIGTKLFMKGEDWLRAALAQDYEHGDPRLGLTYVYYLFQGNYDSPNRRLRERTINQAVGDYGRIDLRRELARFRLDYVYVQALEGIQPVEGVLFSEVYRNRFGTMYAVARQ